MSAVVVRVPVNVVCSKVYICVVLSSSMCLDECMDIFGYHFSIFTKQRELKLLIATFFLLWVIGSLASVH